MTGKVKGTLLIARMKFVLSRGEVDAERVLKRLSAEDQAMLRGMLLPSSWYPAGAAASGSSGRRPRSWSKGRPAQLFLEMGRFTASTNLAPDGAQRPFVREGDPHFLLENVPRIYASQHSLRPPRPTRGPASRRRSSATSTRSGRRRRVPDDAGLAGARRGDLPADARWPEERQCRGRGAAHCEFRVAWR